MNIKVILSKAVSLVTQLCQYTVFQRNGRWTRAVDRWVGPEKLEGRVLMSVTVHEATWQGGNGAWNDENHWVYNDATDIYHGNGKAVVPNNNIQSSTDADLFKVIIPTSVAITLGADYSINGLDVQAASANVAVTLTVSNGKTLNICRNGDNFLQGWVSLSPANGLNASLTLQPQGSSSNATVNAADFGIWGITTGTGSLTVTSGLTFGVTGNFSTFDHALSLNNSGVLNADNAFLTGTGEGTSEINMDGAMNIAHVLQVGGLGEVNFTLTHHNGSLPTIAGVVATNDLYVINRSSFTAKEAGQVVVRHLTKIGNPANNALIVARSLGENTSEAAKLSLLTNAAFAAEGTGDFVVAGGDHTVVKVESGSQLTVTGELKVGSMVGNLIFANGAR